MRSRSDFCRFKEIGCFLLTKKYKIEKYNNYNIKPLSL